MALVFPRSFLHIYRQIGEVVIFPGKLISVSSVWQQSSKCKNQAVSSIELFIHHRKTTVKYDTGLRIKWSNMLFVG